MGGVTVGLALLLLGSQGFGSFAGNMLAVFSGICYASLMISLKLHKTGSQVETLILGNLLAFFFGLPFIFIYPIPFSALAPITFLGIFQIALPYVLFAKASESASALDLALIPILEPILNPIWVFLATGEQPAALTYLGGIILLGVIALRSKVAIKEKH